jgi:hypothetical protein
MSRLWVLAILSLSRDCIRLRRLSGTKGLAIYLKACSVLLQKYCTRRKLNDLTPLGLRVGRTGSVILRIVVPNHGEKIRKNDRVMMRFWMTLLGLCRVLDFRGVFSLKTITSPSRGMGSNSTFLISWFVNCSQIKRSGGWCA